MVTFSDSILTVNQSETIKISNLALELKSRGHDIISLSAGEPDFDTPEDIKISAIEAINNGKTKYTDVSGIPELKNAIIKKFKSDNNLTFTFDEILVSSGGKQVLFNALSSILNPGDEVLIMRPFWVSYPEMVKLCGGKPIIIESSPEKFRLPDIGKLEKATNEKTKCIIINSPNNPSGMIFSRSELDTLKTFMSKNQHIWLISDEIYEHIIFDKNQHLSILNIEPDLKSRTIIINGVSKSHAMTGWRIGFGAGPEELIKMMKKVQSQTTSNPCSISQWASVTALLNSKELVGEFKEKFQYRRDLILKELTKNKLLTFKKPLGGFYLMLDISKLIKLRYKGVEIIKSDFSFSELLLKNTGVAVVPGSAFGMPNHIRISFATNDENIIKACERINSFISELN
ncbi:MAG: pyridoxal phosphate-dependent aminotransferase [Paracoccaceae bacterium]